MAPKSYRTLLKVWTLRLLWLFEAWALFGVFRGFYRHGGWREVATDLLLVAIGVVALFLISPPWERWAESLWRAPKKDRDRRVLDLTKD